MVSVHSDSWTHEESKRGAASGALGMSAGLVHEEAEQEEKVEQRNCGYLVLPRYGKEFVPELYHI